MEVLFIFSALAVGAGIGWLISRTSEQKRYHKLDLEYTAYKATASAELKALREKLENERSELAALGKKFNLEFENIANRILETKSRRFTELNNTNLKTILEPLGQNIDTFRKAVSEAYQAESKERFSLAERVKELAELNQQISKEARELTRALKGEVKTQGRWGEMILESILEK